MAVSTRFGFWTGVILATLALSACGDDAGKKEEKDAGRAPAAGDAGGPFQIEYADLDDNISGAPCSEDTDCKGSGGICTTGVCTGLCEENANCGAGGRCVQPVPALPGGCVKTCQSNDECSGGLECREGYEFDDIISEIQSAGLSFDGGIEVSNIPKMCGPPLGTVKLPNGVVGSACTGDSTCAPGECATNINIFEPFPGGYCTGKCTVDSECGAGGVCYKDPVSEAFKLPGSCLLSCTSNSSCRSGQACRTSIILADNKSYCLSPAPDAGAGGGAASDAGTTTDQ